MTRPVSTALENLLKNNEPFQYAHLVRFERPDGTFTYITDASRNVTYNGNTYLANKLLSVGAISETTKAAASNTSIVIDGNALGSELTASVAVTSGGSGLFILTFTGIDLLDYGFREGDKITINRSGTLYSAKIESFPTLASIKVSSTTLTTFTGSVTITLSSEEIISILMDKLGSNYSSFVNRQVDIYKAYFQEGAIVGNPIYLFKGIISSVNFEDAETAIRVSWGLTSQWGDFAKVNGRVTSDSFHRALDSSGIPQPAAAIRPEYATDLGFQHAESNINMLTKYVVQVEDIKIKKKKIMGITVGVKVKKFIRPEDRFTDLNFNLQANSIPVIYGVRTSEGIPVFADTLKDDSGKVYVVYAVSEGEIGGILDLYVEGQSLICSDEADSEARDEQKVAARNDDSVAVLCRGRADRGDALTGTLSTDPTGTTDYNLYDWGGFNPVVGSFIPFIPPTGYYDPATGQFISGGSSQLYSQDSGGLGHDETLTLTSPQNIKLIFYTGKPDQEACSLLKTISDNQEFKIQTNYAASPENYWSENHRLLDTAYVVAEFKIAEGETTIPEIEYVIRGKFIDCYNYDQSYEGVSGDASLFNIGDTVTFSVGGSAMIIDKFKFKNPDGTDNVRFRWDNPPTVSASSTFSMTKGSNTWTMAGYAVAGDKRVSINPAIQLLDYITSTRYGRGLDVSSGIDLTSWLVAARKCDKRSDVTLKLSNAASASVGAKYQYSSSGLHFQGTVSNISGSYVTFTDVVGKITNKWNSWKSWKVGQVLYTGNDTNLYVVNTAGIKTTEPTSANASGQGLTVVSSLTLTRVGGGTSLTTSASMGNPVQALNDDNQPISGYSLYDSDSINYWKLCGWDEHEQRYVTKYQTNLEIDTAQPLFDNINGFLEHFNGIMRYTDGKYYLDVEGVEPAVPAGDVRNITKDDIIGKIQLGDEGVRSAFNSLVAAFADPAIKFEARNIGFFNSDYLLADRNVPKKGNISVPGITNYYNTRLLAESFLNRSRFGLSINMTLRPSGVLLLAGEVIEVTYPRYGWDNKPFRIESINIQPDSLVDVVAKEYDESFYLEARISRSEEIGSTGPVTRVHSVGAPSDLIVTSAETFDDLLDGVELFWKNHPRAVAGSVVTEVYGSKSPEFAIEVTSVTDNVLTCSEVDPRLYPGMPIYPEVNYKSSLLVDQVYYIKDVVEDNEFTLTNNRQTNTLLTVDSGTGLSVKLRTATLLATVPVPGNSYFDNVPAEGTNAVEKYYWVRHKVTE